jgi:8-oxo-dGTP pyrophosphatase MutT (NUDIX family)
VARLSRAAQPDAARKGRTSRATSCGGIVIRRTEEGPELCLGLRRRDRSNDSWVLPKGTPDGDETTEQTALREVFEETGLEVRIVAPVGAIDYFFTQGGSRIHKTVHFYLMEPIGGSLDAHDHEFDDVRWVPLEEARTLITFPTERQIVEQALEVAGL